MGFIELIQENKASSGKRPINAMGITNDSNVPDEVVLASTGSNHRPAMALAAENSSREKKKKKKKKGSLNRWRRDA